MTPKQRETLDAIKRLTVDGVGPSFEELMLHLGLKSKNQVFQRIKKLEAGGYLRRPIAKSCSRARTFEFTRFDGEITDDILDALPRQHLWSLYARVAERLEIAA